MENKHTILLSLLNFNDALADIDLFHAFCLSLIPSLNDQKRRGQEAAFPRGPKLIPFETDFFAPGCITPSSRMSSGA
jgi:hypothetical protein